MKINERARHAMESWQHAGAIWWKDFKLLLGITLVIVSFVMGFYSKFYFFAKIFAKIYDPIVLITGLSYYAISWLMLFIGAFLIGWESVKLIQNRIERQMKNTYYYTKGLPGKGMSYTKELHKKFKERHKNEPIDVTK